MAPGLFEIYVKTNHDVGEGSLDGYVNIAAAPIVQNEVAVPRQKRHIRHILAPLSEPTTSYPSCEQVPHLPTSHQAVIVSFGESDPIRVHKLNTMTVKAKPPSAARQSATTSEMPTRRGRPRK